MTCHPSFNHPNFEISPFSQKYVSSVVWAICRVTINETLLMQSLHGHTQ